MIFDELKIGDFLYFKYDSTTDAYIYIDKIEDEQVFYHEIRVLNRKQKFTYEYCVQYNTLWNDRDYIFIRFEKLDDINILIEYIFEYEYKEII